MCLLEIMSAFQRIACYRRCFFAKMHIMECCYARGALNRCRIRDTGWISIRYPDWYAASVVLAALFLLYAFFYAALPRLFYGFLLMGIAAVVLYIVRANNQIYVFFCCLLS